MGMEDLPSDVKLNIFSRLPALSILDSKQVCKSWLCLLEDPCFAQIHLRRQIILLQQCDGDGGGGVAEFGFLVKVELDSSYDPESEHSFESFDSELLYVKYDENDEQSYKIVKRINHEYPVLEGIDNMIGSCNGLICLSIDSIPNRPTIDIGDPTYIFNPCTREYVELPIFGKKSGRWQLSRILSGFGYHPSTNEYKVVRIFYPDYEESFGQVQIYTLGAGSGWRDKGDITYPLSSMYGHTRTATVANGKLHWLGQEENIVAFDLADEEFSFIPLPPIIYLDGQRDRYEKNSRRLCVLPGDWLGVAHHVLSEMGGNSHVDIWLRKKKSMPGWSKEFTIPRDDNDYIGNDDYIYEEDISLLALTKRGEILFWDSNYFDSICRYDPKSATIEKLELNGSMRTEAMIPHINSFVSLKALGESLTKCIKISLLRR